MPAESVNRVLNRKKHGAARSDRCGENEPPPTKATAGSAPVSCWFPSSCFVPCGQHMIFRSPSLFALHLLRVSRRSAAIAYYNPLPFFPRLPSSELKTIQNEHTTHIISYHTTRHERKTTHKQRGKTNRRMCPACLTHHRQLRRPLRTPRTAKKRTRLLFETKRDRTEHVDN